MSQQLRVVRVAEVEAPKAEAPAWLVEELWSAGAVGVIGGAPKSGKTWLALEITVAVASGRPCLGRYPVPQPGPVLVYAAEDSPLQVRDRLRGLAQARGAEFADLDVRLILEPALRLDFRQDVARLRVTLSRHRPRLLVLDPYVRLQRVDENDATAVSGVLGTLRELSRVYEVAIVLVHHMRKSAGDLPGQALRGSSDLHAWGDSNLYLGRRQKELTLRIEHRAAASPPPVELELVSGEGPTRLEVRAVVAQVPLPDRVLCALEQDGPQRHRQLRQALHARNEDLGATLRELERSGSVVRTDQGWAAATRAAAVPRSPLKGWGTGNAGL